MDTFSNLPTRLKSGIAATGGGLVVAGVFIGTGQWVFFAVLLLFVAIGLAGYFGWRGFKRKQQAARMTNEMQQHTTASPRAISDPAARARLDSMRQKFDKGITEYRSRGKDLYSLPWYVFVGVPGSGKTEAIRHSNVGFPPGMQDEFQGVGGTINMDWWFTNHAVILDTAGKLIFEDVKPGEQSEWRAFLELLKKNRANCPINGLFLAIPSDSLISDSADEISKKAGRIAQQLDVIQRVLDVRFPVYVIVTKCDKINGFREFFDDLSDPQLQHQMMGWSNPDPLDTAFRAELVDQHLDKVVNRLRRRRMGVLRDPASQSDNPAARRADEVDALFALPQSLALLAPRLRRYLETIFVAGEWSAKPLFLRGIYFTSSMREGAALDEELAKAIGVAPEELGDEKMWERERAYFLRDLFIDKVFREKGLVTRATNTSRMLRSRQLAMYGAGSAALAIFILLAWFSIRDLGKSVGTTSNKWTKVSEARWHNNNVWKQSIVPLEGADYADTIRTHVKLGKEIPIGDFHDQLRREATTPPTRGFLSFIFPGVYSDFREDSRRAQRVVFENGVVYPLLDATRQKIKRGVNNPEALQHLPAALAALLELEAAVLAGQKGGEPGRLKSAEAEQFLSALARFVSPQDGSIPPRLAAVMADTYSDRDAAATGWPSPRLGSVGPATKLHQSEVTDSALKQLKDYSVKNVETRKEAWNQARDLRTAVANFEQVEKQLFEVAPSANAPKLLQALATLGGHASNIDAQLKSAAASGLFQGGLSLSNAYYQFQTGVMTNAYRDVENVRKANTRARTRVPNEFFREVDTALEDIKTAVAEKISETQQAENIEILARLDQDYLLERRFAQRWELYNAVYEACLDKAFRQQDLLGAQAEALQQRLAGANAHREKHTLYKGPLAERVHKAMDYAWQVAYAAQCERFRRDYLTDATNKIRPYILFPLCGDPARQPLDADKVEAVSYELTKISKDLSAASGLHPSFTNHAAWTGFAAKISAYANLVSVLLDLNNKPVRCEISLAPFENATDADPGKWRAKWESIAITGEPVTTRSIKDERLAVLPIDKPISFTFENRDGVRGPGPVLGMWGAVRLIFAEGATRNPDNSWSVPWPAGKRDEGNISLKIKFQTPSPLPEIKNWCGPL